MQNTSVKSQAIWHPHPQPSSPLTLFRQRLTLSAESSEGHVLAAASGPFAVYVNGELTGRGSGGDLAQGAVWERVDIGRWLAEGENTVLIAVLGTTAGDWLRAECSAVGRDGKRREFHTGTPWQVWCDDAWQRGAVCAYIAPQAKGGWARGHIGEENWQGAAVVDGPTPSEWDPLVAQEREVSAREVVAWGEVDADAALTFVEFPDAMRNVKFVHREALLTVGKTQTLVQTRSAERAAYVLLDFGRVVYGHPRLRLRGIDGVVVDLAFARARGAVQGAMRYVCAAGKSDWTAPEAVACRYVLMRVSACSEEMEIDCVSIMEQHFATEGESTFTAHELDDLWRVGLPSLVEARRQAYLSEVGGGRGSWLHHYVLGLNDFYRTAHVHTLGAALQGAVEPDSTVERAFFALCIAAHHCFSGNSPLARRLLPEAEEMLGGLHPHEADTATCALYSGAYGQLSALYAEWGETSRAENCEGLEQAWRAAVASRWLAERGLLQDAHAGSQTSQWAHALALYFNLLSAEQARAASAALSAADVPLADAWQAFFLAGGLWQHGLGERARACIDAHWGRLLSREGISWRDRAATLDIVPGVDALLAQHALGVQWLRAADRAVEVRPQAEPMQRVSGTVGVGADALSIEWSLNGAGYFSLVVECATAGELRLAVPRLGKRFPTVSLNGETVWRNEKIYPNFYAHEVVSEADYVVLVVRKAGRYHAELSA